MDIQHEYFLIGRVNNNNHPLLILTKGFYEDDKEYVENPEPMEYRLGAPIPKKPMMADFHSSPCSVISQKIHDVLDKLDVKRLQLIPATIVGKNDERYENYWYVNAYNKLRVLDREKSIHTWNDVWEEANPIEKLVLDEDKINRIPLEERLVFSLAENTTFEIYHKSVVDAIMAVNPEGIQFTSVAEWRI